MLDPSKISEINALIELVDDESYEVFDQIRNRLISYGRDVIPLLELAWEQKGYGEEFQTRIEDIIHDLQYSDVSTALKDWALSKDQDLITGLLLISKYQYPEIETNSYRKQLKDLCEEFSMINNDKVSHAQQLIALNAFLFNNKGFSGNKKNYYHPDNSILTSVLDKKKGNPLLMSLLYIIVANHNNIPIVGINLPRHFVVALKGEFKIEFYLSPFNRGSVLQTSDIQEYLSKLNLPFEEQYYNECTNLDMIKRVLLNLINCYSKAKKKEKMEDVSALYEQIKDI